MKTVLQGGRGILTTVNKSGTIPSLQVDWASYAEDQFVTPRVRIWKLEYESTLGENN